MADGTKAGGDAPRTLFSLGRSKRKGRADAASPLEDYPPRHVDETVADEEVSPLESIEDTDIEAAHAELLRDDAEVTTGDDTTDSTDSTELESPPCPSCAEPLVAGAMFCGECGTRVTVPEDAAPAAVLLDETVPGEPLPPEAEGSFEVAEPVTGSFEDDELLDDDLADDDGTEIEESAVFGAFIAADTDEDLEPEAELVEDEPVDELVEGDEPVDELVEDDEPVDELVEGDEPVDELVEEELVEEDPEAELVEREPLDDLDDLVDHDDDDDTLAGVVALGAGATAGGAAVIAATSTDEAEPLESTAAAAGGSGGGSKKGMWIGAAAAAAAVVLIIGVVAMGSGSKSDTNKDDQLAAGTQKSTTTTAGASTTASTATTEAPSTTDSSAPVTTDTSALPSSTVTTVGQVTPTTGTPPVGPTVPPPAPPADVQVDCPGNLASPSTNNRITLHNVGGTQTSFLVTWSALKTGVTVSPTAGSVAAKSSTVINVNVAPGTPGSGSRVTIKWSGGATSCNLLVQ